MHYTCENGLSYYVLHINAMSNMSDMFTQICNVKCV